MQAQVAVAANWPSVLGPQFVGLTVCGKSVLTVCCSYAAQVQYQVSVAAVLRLCPRPHRDQFCYTCSTSFARRAYLLWPKPQTLSRQCWKTTRNGVVLRWHLLVAKAACNVTTLLEVHAVLGLTTVAPTSGQSRTQCHHIARSPRGPRWN